MTQSRHDLPANGAGDTDPTRPDPRRWKALGLLCTAFFMVALDGQIVILALPSVQTDLGFTVTGLQWVLSGYLLSFGGLLLLGGRVADVLGHRKLFTAGVVLFLVSSLLCGLAWSGEVLITARVLQGVSAAVMSPTALALLTTTFDEGPERNRALAVWTGTGAFGATAALLVGGVLTDVLGWEWIFFINVPVALVMLALTPRLLRESTAPVGGGKFDIGGAITSTAAVVLLIFAVVEAPAVGWGSARTITLIAVSVVLAAAFVFIEKRSPSPLVPPHIFRSSALTGGNLMMILVGMLLLGFNVVVSLYGQQVLLLTPVIFGLGTLAYALTDVLSANGAGALVSRFGYRPVALVGMLLFGLGSLLMTRVSADGSYFGDLFWGLLAFGAAVGTSFVAVTVAALAGVPDEEAGLASGINNAAFWIGGALGTAVVSTVAVSFTTGSDAQGLTDGFSAAFRACAAFAATGVVVALVLPAKRGASESVEVR
ncbi:MFS transporter [Saccharothrix sp. Mg75]|uniref:MFS transporter n=1 Tax=Saccharothrix sp. Mg75 TaxID=3445357 RepID=UPI003EE86496